MTHRHSEYILTPLFETMTEASIALSNVGKGFDVYPLRDYFLRALFLKMTGAQEQKCKCICWDIATYDYDYRYETFSRWSLGECSRLEDKDHVVTALLKRLPENDRNVDDLQKQAIIDGIKLDVIDFYDRCSVLGWPKYELDDFVDVYSNMIPHCLLAKNEGEDVCWMILRGRCKGCPHAKSKGNPKGCVTRMKKGWGSLYHDSVYVHRNECAHNTLSCQINRPSFLELNVDEEHKRNYYFRFSLLLVIDRILMILYEKWSNQFEGTKFQG